jgi:colicin import membrane protein
VPLKGTKPPVRAKRTKAEVQQEFAEIQDQAQQARESPDVKGQEAARLRESEVRQAVEAVSVGGVVQRISGLGLEVSRALAELSGKLTEEVQLLASAREAVLLERKELERLHKIDIAATAVDQMVQDYAREKQQLEAEIAAQRTVWEQESERAERDRWSRAGKLSTSLRFSVSASFVITSNCCSNRASVSRRAWSAAV